ncbi:MAG: hypothetical protein H0V19_10555, partial [Euzebyales bacterium]|nr:hypothetical protein [Euzebyales bacterium]
MSPRGTAPDAGTAQLREQLDAITQALQAFADPNTEQYAGLRLMRDALVERSEHLRETITTSETCALTVTVTGPPAEHGGLDLAFTLPLLSGLQDALYSLADQLAAADAVPPPAEEVAAAVTLRLASAGEGTLRLQRQEGPLDSQLVQASSQTLLVELALDGLVGVLAGIVVGDTVHLQLALSAVQVDDREVSVTRAAA